MSQEQDKIFFRNFTLALVFIAVMMVVFYVVAQFAGTDEEADAKMRATAVAEATAPVGEVTAVGEEMAEEMVEETATAASGEASGDVGKTVYDKICVNCHGVDALADMIPQTGDAPVWDARLEKGIGMLYSNAINGFTGELGMMPPRGSSPDLSDDEVKAAVDYMIELSKPEGAMASASGDMGKKVYDGLCVNCHGADALADMIPQTGDAPAWEARLEKGIETLYSNAIDGFTGDQGMMPPRGSNPALSDEEVKAAVDYMVELSK